MFLKRIFTLSFLCSIIISQGIYAVEPTPVPSTVGASDSTDIVPYSPSTSYLSIIWSYLTLKKVLFTGAVVTVGTYVGLSYYRKHLVRKLDGKLGENRRALDIASSDFDQHDQARKRGEAEIGRGLTAQSSAIGGLEQGVAGFGSAIQTSLEQSQRGLAVILDKDDSAARISDLNARLEWLERKSRQNYLDLGNLLEDGNREFDQEMRAFHHEQRAMITHATRKTQSVRSALGKIESNNSALSGTADRLLQLAQPALTIDSRGSQASSKRLN